MADCNHSSVDPKNNMCRECNQVIRQEISSCSHCPMVKTCAVYIAGLETLKVLESKFVEDFQILEKITWKAEDLANGCKYKPKRMEFGI